MSRKFLSLGVAAAATLALIIPGSAAFADEPSPDQATSTSTAGEQPADDPTNQSTDQDSADAAAKAAEQAKKEEEARAAAEAARKAAEATPAPTEIPSTDPTATPTSSDEGVADPESETATPKADDPTVTPTPDVTQVPEEADGTAPVEPTDEATETTADEMVDPVTPTEAVQSLNLQALLLGAAANSTPVNPDGWNMAAETRPGGHNVYTDNGLHVWTDSNTSADKAAGYKMFDTPVLLSSLTTDPTITQTVNSGGRASVQLVLTACGTTGYLVGEPWAYGDGNWWSNKAFVSQPGMGYNFFGSLSDIVAACPDATIGGVGYSMGSGVKGDVLIEKLTVGDVDYTFGLEGPKAVHEEGSNAPICAADGTSTTTSWTRDGIQPYIQNDDGEWVLGDITWGDKAYTTSEPKADKDCAAKSPVPPSPDPSTTVPGTVLPTQSVTPTTTTTATMVIAIGPKAGTPSGSELAHTGASWMAPAIGGAVLALVLGFSLVLIARRRTV